MALHSRSPAADQESESFIEVGNQLNRRQRANSRCGELDGQRQAVEAATQLANCGGLLGVDHQARCLGVCALDEETLCVACCQ